MAETPKYSFRRIEPNVGKLGQMERKHGEPVHTVQVFNYHLEKADRLQEKLGASSLVGGGGGGTQDTAHPCISRSPPSAALCPRGCVLARGIGFQVGL